MVSPFCLRFGQRNLVIGSATDALVNDAEPHITVGLPRCQGRRVTDRPVGRSKIQQIGERGKVAACHHATNWEDWPE